MTFTEDSGLVMVWVRLIEQGKKTLDQVSKIYNLREVVEEVLNSHKTIDDLPNISGLKEAVLLNPKDTNEYVLVIPIDDEAKKNDNRTT